MADQGSPQNDFIPMLCRVCSDKAGGLHYGVHSCERCGRFFKRCIKHRVQNKPCKNNQQCSIFWYNRNKCNSCRLNKCIAVGMSKDVPKRGKSVTLSEKLNIHTTKKKTKVPDNEMQEIISAMQKMRIPKGGKYKITAPMKKSKSKISTYIKKMNIPEGKKSKMLIQSTASVQTMKTNSPDEDLSAELEEELKLTASTEMAQEDICDLTKKFAALSGKARTHPSKSYSQLLCPLSTPPYPKNKGTTYSKKELLERFATVIKGVIQFGKSMPCFNSLSQWDQDVLLKAGVFEVLLVKLANNFNPQDSRLLCFDELFLLNDSVEADSDEGFLCKSLFDFAERMSKLHLSRIETTLFGYILLVAADHPGLRNAGQVMRVQNKLIGMLQGVVQYSNHTENPNVFSDLMKMIPTVRILNCLHSKKFMTYEMEPGGKPETVGQIIERIYEIMNGNENSPTHPSQRKLLVDHPSVARSKEVNSSPGRQSGSSTISYECSTTDSIGNEKLYPMCVGDSNSSLQTSSSVSHVHDDPGPYETIQTINLIHEVRSAKADESDNEVISGVSLGGCHLFDSTTKPPTDSGFES